MVRRNFKHLSCDLDDNGPESVHRAVALAQLFSTSNALSAPQAARLAILVEEAVTNLYDHAAPGRGFSGRLELQSDADALHVTLSDSGAGFDPRDAAAAEAPNAERGGGVGLALIRAWADIVDYRRDGEMNRLELRLKG